MKSAIISDIHFMNKSKYNPILREYEAIIFPIMNLELTYQKAKEYNCDNVIILGDLIDKSTVSSYLVHKLISFFKDVDIETIILLGNHDIVESNENFYSFVSVLEEINSNIRVISDVQYITNDIVAVPYSHREKIVQEDSIRDKILLTHIGISECKLSQTKRIPADFSLSQLKYFVRVLTGHYHYPQEIENVLVIGSPWEIKRDEFEHDTKRIVIYDFDKLSYTSVNSIRKRLEPVRISSIKQLNTELQKIRESNDAYLVRRFDISFNIPRDIVENIENEFGSIVILNFINENTEYNVDVSSLKKLQEFKLDRINLDSMFFEYVKSNLSEDEYKMVEKDLKEVV